MTRNEDSGATSACGKTIKTAPKTGERILIWGDPRLVGCEIDPHEWEPDWNIGYWDGERWADASGDAEILMPTHWLPLPPPPTEQEKPA